MRFTYPAFLQRVSDSEVIVAFRDLPECRTSGQDVLEAVSEAQDALAEAIAGRIDDEEEIPEPSVRRSGEYNVAVPTELAAKAALAIACRRSGQSLAALADALGIDQQALSQLIDPRGANDSDQISQALRTLGSELVLEVRTLAPVSGK
jgi:antitoxin HicB